MCDLQILRCVAQCDEEDEYPRDHERNPAGNPAEGAIGETKVVQEAAVRGAFIRVGHVVAGVCHVLEPRALAASGMQRAAMKAEAALEAGIARTTATSPTTHDDQPLTSCVLFAGADVVPGDVVVLESRRRSDSSDAANLL